MIQFNTDRPIRTANWNVRDLCREDTHDTRKSAEECGVCHAILCSICGTDRHHTSDGHDLSDPRYWGV